MKLASLQNDFATGWGVGESKILEKNLSIDANWKTGTLRKRKDQLIEDRGWSPNKEKIGH